MRRLRIGIMGCASIAKKHVLPALQELPEYEIRAIASRDREKAEAFTREFGGEAVHGYEALVNRDDLDVAYVPLPTGLHAEWVKKLLLADKHVMVEKSLAARYVDACGLVSLAQNRNRVLMEHFQFLHHSQMAFVQQTIREGGIGEIRLIRSSFGFPPLGAGNFRYDAGLGGGALLDAGAYTLRVSQVFLGQSLRVQSALMLPNSTGTVDLQGAAQLVSDSGVPAQAAWGFNHFYQCSVEIWGQLGRILQDRAFTAPPGFSPRVLVETATGRREHLLPPDNHFKNLWRAFHAFVLAGCGNEARAAILTQARLISEVRSQAGHGE
jgi:dTDP-3,4-didehydro-2,6-dideoxy-alpha-D-glucose 3-reductase